MRQFNRDRDIINSLQSYQPQPIQGIDWAGALNAYTGARDKALDDSRREALAAALGSGDQEQIDKAALAADPAAFYANRLAQAQRQQQRDWAVADREQQHQWDLEKLEKMNQNALGLAKAKAMMDSGQNGQQSANALNDAIVGVNTLQEVADAGRIGNWTRARQKINATSDAQDMDLGKLSTGISQLVPFIMQKAKDAGVSGINTQGEAMLYLGLPENPTSLELKGALPKIRQRLGLPEVPATVVDYTEL